MTKLCVESKSNKWLSKMIVYKESCIIHYWFVKDRTSSVQLAPHNNGLGIQVVALNDSWILISNNKIFHRFAFEKHNLWYFVHIFQCSWFFSISFNIILNVLLRFKNSSAHYVAVWKRCKRYMVVCLTECSNLFYPVRKYVPTFHLSFLLNIFEFHFSLFLSVFYFFLICRKLVHYSMHNYLPIRINTCCIMWTYVRLTCKFDLRFFF